MSSCARHAALLSLALAMVCQSYRFVELQEIPSQGAARSAAFSMNGTQHLAVANHRDRSSFNIESKIYKWNDASSTFLEMQAIPTKGALAWAAFSINGIQHLAVANHRDLSSHNIESKIYKWNDVSRTFLETQSIPTAAAVDFTAFSMHGTQHLVVANSFDDSTRNVDSKVYRWDDASSTFLEMQSIPTNGARGWAAFSMNGIQHLAVANSVNDTSYNVESKIYKWNDASSSFLEMQRIPTKCAQQWAAFSINGIQHLAVANHRDISSYNVESKIYKWNDASSTFLEMQAIPTKGALHWAAFSINGIQHLAVANLCDLSSFNVESKIYKWNDVSRTFLETQSIPTAAAVDFTAFSMHGTQHLVVANSFDDSTRNVDSKVYRWDDASSTFLEMQSIPTNGARGWAAFSMNGIQHLAVANSVNDTSYNVESKIYKWNDASSSFLEMQRIPTKCAQQWAAFSINGIQHLAVANHRDISSYNVESKIYKWNDASSTFLEMQAIPTKGALHWAAFSINGIQHLAVANLCDLSSFNVESKIYKWNDASSTFLEMQAIPTKGAHAWAAFSINGIQHLVVANGFDDSFDSYTTYSKVYIWETSTTTTTSTITSTATMTTATATMTTSSSASTTTTRTEAPSVLEAIDFAFEDVRSWSLAALGGYLVALSVPIFMARMCEQAGSRPRQSIEEPRTVGISVEEGPDYPAEPPGSVMHADAASASPAVHGAEAKQSEGTPLAQAADQASAQKFLPRLGLPETFTGARQIIKKSKYVLAVKMLLESGNLLSSPPGLQNRGKCCTAGKQLTGVLVLKMYRRCSCMLSVYCGPV